MNTDYPRKVKYYKYVQGFNENKLRSFVEGQQLLLRFDMEKMRGLIYGYTFTKDYSKGIIPDTLSIDWWWEENRPKNKKDYHLGHLYEHINQWELIYNAIKSTGDGTIDNPYCVICVEHEYEFLKGICPLEIVRQYLLPGYIDCFELEADGFSQTIYFDISRWFEKVRLL